MFLREIFVNPRRKSILAEGGGNIWPDTVEFYPTPDLVQALLTQVKTYLHKAGFPLHLQGSGANQDPEPEHPTGDLDVSCDMDQVKQYFKIPQSKKLADDDKAARNALEQFLLNNGVPATYKAGVTVHIKFPYNKQFYQCDIKVVRKAEKVSKFHQHIIPRGSPYKGVHKQVVMSALASAKNMLWSPDEGLYARDANRKKADLITDDWDKVAQVLLGPGHTGRDLGSAESIMAAIKDPALKQQVHDAAVGGSSWTSTPLRGPATPLMEAATVGRKYQHIEDLVFTGIPSKNISPGVEAGLQAVRIIRDMASQSKGKSEIKWDGSPVVYWGRDQEGRFMLLPKNAWEYLKRGKKETTNGVSTVMTSPKDISNFILNTGEAEPGKEKQRQSYANQLANLWTYFESISPQNGFIEGGLLFYPGTKPKGGTAMPVLNNKTGDYDFTPNITSFHIPANSELGQRIAKAKVMVAATGFYNSLGDGSESRYPNAEELSTSDVIVQGTTYVEEAPGIDESLVDQAEEFISTNGQSINSFLAPKQGLSRVGDILYKFYNQNLRIAGVKHQFANWANENLSSAQAVKVVSDPGLDAVLTAVEKLSIAKLDMYKRASTGTHSGIRQTKPEGYVYQDPDTGQFVKAISQADWAPRKD